MKIVRVRVREEDRASTPLMGMMKNVDDSTDDDNGDLYRFLLCDGGSVPAPCYFFVVEGEGFLMFEYNENHRQPKSETGIVFSTRLSKDTLSRLYSHNQQ